MLMLAMEVDPPPFWKQWFRTPGLFKCRVH